MTITRRSVIQGAGATGSLLLTGDPPLWARGEQPPDEPAPLDYVRLSAALIGVDAWRLEPEARDRDTPLADTFHALSREAAPAATAALLAAWREAAGDAATGPEAAGRLRTGGGRPREDGVGALARLTMLMWLYGAWYGGAEAARALENLVLVQPCWLRSEFADVLEPASKFVRRG